MQENDSLTDRVVRYQDTGQGYDRIVGELSDRIYRYPLSKPGCTEDDAGEFYLFFLPRLKRLLGRFKESGVPFEHYLNSVLFWNLKSYRRKVRRTGFRRQTDSCQEFWEFLERNSTAHEEDFLDVSWMKLFPLDGSGMIKGNTARKRFLFLILRMAKYLESGDMGKISCLTGYESDWLWMRVRNLKATLGPKERRLKVLRERRNRAFYMHRLLEERMGWEFDESRRFMLKKEIERLGRRAWMARDEISHVPVSPTHRAIAKEMKVPKGTVDTGIRWFRKEWEGLYSRRQMEYA
jgi:hypothetical protein